MVCRKVFLKGDLLGKIGTQICYDCYDKKCSKSFDGL